MQVFRTNELASCIIINKKDTKYKQKNSISADIVHNLNWS